VENLKNTQRFFSYFCTFQPYYFYTRYSWEKSQLDNSKYLHIFPPIQGKAGLYLTTLVGQLHDGHPQTTGRPPTWRQSAGYPYDYHLPRPLGGPPPPDRHLHHCNLRANCMTTTYRRLHDGNLSAFGDNLTAAGMKTTWLPLLKGRLTAPAGSNPQPLHPHPAPSPHSRFPSGSKLVDIVLWTTLLPTEFLPGQRKLKEQNKTGGSDLNTAQIDFKRKVNLNFIFTLT
jgi:hypothetical protein